MVSMKRIVLLGISGSGKSSLGNLLVSGPSLDTTIFQISNNVKSQTKDTQEATFEYNGTTFKVICNFH